MFKSLILINKIRIYISDMMVCEIERTNLKKCTIRIISCNRIRDIIQRICNHDIAHCIINVNDILINGIFTKTHHIILFKNIHTMKRI